jgi:hypothetical protein
MEGNRLHVHVEDDAGDDEQAEQQHAGQHLSPALQAPHLPDRPRPAGRARTTQAVTAILHSLSWHVLEGSAAVRAGGGPRTTPASDSPDTRRAPTRCLLRRQSADHGRYIGGRGAVVRVQAGRKLRAFGTERFNRSMLHAAPAERSRKDVGWTPARPGAHWWGCVPSLAMAGRGDG